MASVSDPTNKYKSLITSLQKSLECPICLETVKTPFKMCGRGHVVCQPCLKQMNKCPMCQDVLTSENPVSIKSILEMLPHLCRFSVNGCEEVVEPGNDHERFCGYGLTSCWEGCSDRVPILLLMEHYKKQHPTTLICSNKTHCFEINIPNKLPQSWWHSIEASPVFLFDNWFWLLPRLPGQRTEAEDKEFCISFQFIATPIGKLEHNYYARVTIEEGDFNYTHTLKAIIAGGFKTRKELEDELKKAENEESDEGESDEGESNEDESNEDESNEDESNEDESNEDKSNEDESNEDELESFQYKMKIPYDELTRFIQENTLKLEVYFFREQLV